MNQNYIADKIGELFEENKVYRDADYSIDKLAADLSLEKGLIMKVFDENLDHTFEEMLCLYRYCDPQCQGKSYNYIGINEAEYQETIDRCREFFRKLNPEFFRKNDKGTPTQ